MATQTIPRVTEEEYLRLERAAEYKSEFVGGEIFAMPGGKLRHSRLAVRWAVELEPQLRDRGCSVFSSDARVRTPSTGSYVYPDVSVVCGEVHTHENADDILTNPIVIIEVLSPSTANYDRSQKFELYREIPSMRDYILAHTGSARVEHFSRQSDASWIFREYQGLEAEIHVPSIDCTVRLGSLYRSVFDLPA